MKLRALSIVTLLLACLPVQTEANFAPTLVLEPSARNAGGTADLSMTIAGDIGGSDARDRLQRIKWVLPEGMMGFPYNAPRCRYAEPHDVPDLYCRPESRVGAIDAWAWSPMRPGPEEEDLEYLGGYIYLAGPPPGSTSLASLHIVLALGGPGGGDPLLEEPLVIKMNASFNPVTQRIEIDSGDFPDTVYITRMEATIVAMTVTGKPFIKLPTTCDRASAKVSLFSSSGDIDSFNPDITPSIASCTGPRFQPSLATTLTNSKAGQPTGLISELTQPNETPSQTHMRKLELNFPAGITANSLVDGITPCKAEAFANWYDYYAPNSPCPDASKVGMAFASSPALGTRLLSGTVNMVTSEPGQPLKVVLLILERDIKMKVEGTIGAFREGGRFRLKAVFDDLPQVPISFMNMWVSKPLLRNPYQCGSLSFSALFTSHLDRNWTGTPTVNVTCPASLVQPPLDADFSVSADDNSAGADPRTLRMETVRSPGGQSISGLTITFPEGLLANPNAVPSCPAGSATCSTESKVGDVDAEVRIGNWTAPITVSGSLYMAEPSGSEPVHLLAVLDLPPIAGGGQLTLHGHVEILQPSFQIKVHFDGLPTDFDVRLMNIKMHSPASRLFYNPSSCDEARIVTEFEGELGATQVGSAPYSARNCATQRFSPSFDIRLSDVAPGSSPTLTTEIGSAGGDATFSSVEVGFPKELGVNLSAIPTPGSVIGSLKVWSPLLQEPLAGAVSMSGSTGAAIALKANLSGSINGYPLSIELPIDVTVNPLGGLVARSHSIPQVPVSRIELTVSSGLLKVGKLCRPLRFSASFYSHSQRWYEATDTEYSSPCSPSASLKLKSKSKDHKRPAFELALSSNEPLSDAAIEITGLELTRSDTVKRSPGKVELVTADSGDLGAALLVNGSKSRKLTASGIEGAEVELYRTKGRSLLRISSSKPFTEATLTVGTGALKYTRRNCKVGATAHFTSENAASLSPSVKVTRSGKCKKRRSRR